MERGLAAIEKPVVQHGMQRFRLQTSPAIGVGYGKNDFPLAEQRTVRGAQRVFRIVDVGGLRRCAVQFDDLESFSTSECVGIAVADIVAAEVEAIDRSR